MAQQTINVGTAPNDGTGTPLRTAFQYTNSNFSELYTALGGGAGLPGASTQVLFNNGTNIAGDAGLVYNSTTDALTIGGNVGAASATITGDLTVKTNVLKVDTTNNRVGIGTASPGYALDVVGVMQLGGTANPVFRLATGTNTGFIDYDNTRLQIHAGALPILFVAGNTLKATLDSSGNLGLGVTPSAWVLAGYKALEVGVVGNGVYSGSGDFNLSANAYYSGGWKYAASTIQASSYQQNAGQHIWKSAASGTAGNAITDFNAPQMVLNANGALVLKGGTVGANGVGIAFPATQAASSDANTLDDYEEGTFTPAISGTGTAGSGTYSIQTGSYTKVGRVVTVNIYLTWTAHTGTGDITITGLPFTSANTTSHLYGATVGFFEGISLSASNIPHAYIGQNSSSISLRQLPTGGGTEAPVPMDTTGQLVISATYNV